MGYIHGIQYGLFKDLISHLLQDGRILIFLIYSRWHCHLEGRDTGPYVYGHKFKFSPSLETWEFQKVRDLNIDTKRSDART